MGLGGGGEGARGSVMVVLIREQKTDMNRLKKSCHLGYNSVKSVQRHSNVQIELCVPIANTLSHQTYCDGTITSRTNNSVHLLLLLLLLLLLIIIIIIIMWSRDSSVGIATGYGLDGPRDRSSSPGRVKIFLFSTSPRLPLSPRVKRPESETDHKPPASAEVKKMWIYTSAPPYAFMA
jgi:hypothetical protein